MDNLEKKCIPPSVCICVPVRNGGKTIGQTLTSLLNQSYSNFEIVVCDNLSNDNTSEVLADFVSKAKNPFTIINNTTPGTAEDNWNFLLNNLASKAEFVALYHADDLYDQNIVAKQVNLLKSRPVGAVFSLSHIINEKNENISKRLKHSTTLPREIEERHVFDYESLLYYTMKYYNFIKTPTLLFRREILEKYDVFFDTKYCTSADLDFWLRIAAMDKIAIVPEPLHYYRMSTSQGSYTLLKGKLQPADYFRVMNDHIKNMDNVNPMAVRWHQAHESMDFVMCALNLTKANKKTEASTFLRNAIKTTHLPLLAKIPNGIKLFLFGFALKVALWTSLEKFLIKLISH